MSQHTPHRTGKKRVLKADGALLEAQLLEEVGDGVDHAHLIVEADDVVEDGQGADILDVGHRHPESNDPLSGDHRVGAESPVSGQVRHVRRFREQQDVQTAVPHKRCASGDALAMSLSLHLPLLLLLVGRERRTPETSRGIYQSRGSKNSLAAPHSGHTQSSGSSSKEVPGGMSASGSPSAGS